MLKTCKILIINANISASQLETGESGKEGKQKKEKKLLEKNTEKTHTQKKTKETHISQTIFVVIKHVEYGN